MNLEERFDKFDDEYHKFERVAAPRSTRADLHAFLLLNDLQPTSTDMVACAEHDEIWLGVDCEALNKVISDDQVQELARCGIRYDSDVDSLAMFV